MSYFPMYIELKDRPCLVVGGGRIALRKVEVLRDFGASVTVVSPEILPEIKAMKGVSCLERGFENADLAGRELVVAATDEKRLNRDIAASCRAAKIPVNAVDQAEDCSFIFPAYLKEGEVVASFSSGGLSPVITQYLKEQLRPVLTPLLGRIAACLGALRPGMGQRTGSEAQRKKIYRELLRIGLEKAAVPSEAEIEETIEKYRNE